MADIIDSIRWTVTRRRIVRPMNAIVYRARKIGSPEDPLPKIGEPADKYAGPPYSGHVITEVGDFIRSNKLVLWFHFVDVSAFTGQESFVDWESMAYVFPAIYPTEGLQNFAGGSLPRSRTVPAEVTYEFHHGAEPPSAWINAPAEGQGLDDPLRVKSYIAEAASHIYEVDGGGSRRVGRWLSTPHINQNTINDQVDINLQAPDSLSYGVPPSAPSATTYDGWVTDKKRFVADRVVSRWQGEIWMRRTRRVVAQ